MTESVVVFENGSFSGRRLEKKEIPDNYIMRSGVSHYGHRDHSLPNGIILKWYSPNYGNGKVSIFIEGETIREEPFTNIIAIAELLNYYSSLSTQDVESLYLKHSTNKLDVLKEELKDKREELKNIELKKSRLIQLAQQFKKSIDTAIVELEKKNK